MFLKSLFSRFMVIGFCLTGSMFFISNGQKLLLNRNEVTVNLKSLLNFMHNCYEKKANFGTMDYGDLIRVKKIIRGFFVANMNWLVLDIKSNISLNYLLHSNDPIDRELAVYINGITIIDNEDLDPCDNFELYMADDDKVEFLNECLFLAFDQNLNVRRAVYDFLCTYIPKHEELYHANKNAYSNIINTGLIDQDKFIRDCALSFKNNEIISRDDSCDRWQGWTEAPKLSDLFSQTYLKNLANEATSYVNSNDIFLKCKGLGIFKQLVENDIYNKEALQAIKKCIKNIGDKNVFKALVDLSESLIDKNFGIKEIIDIVSNIELANCNYDLDKSLLWLYTRLADFSEFFKPGLKLACRYKVLGGTFSYGNLFDAFLDNLVATCVKSNCHTNELREFAEKYMQDYESLSSFYLGITIYEELVSKGVFLNECATFIKHMRKISDDKLNGFLWSLYERLVQKDFAIEDAIEYANFLANKSKEDHLSQAASLFDSLVLKGYARQDALKCLDKIKKSNDENLMGDYKELEKALDNKHD